MNFAAALTQLNLLLNDTDNFTFTIDQKSQALALAYGDSDVVTPVWDSSLVFSISQYQYAIPGVVSVIKDIYLNRSTDAFPDPISRELWEVVGSNIQFLNDSRLYIPSGQQLWIKGAYKVTTNDSLSSVSLQNFVTNLAGQITLRQLAFMKGLRFLRNDTTMADIINLRNTIDRDVARYRAQLQRDFQSA